MAHSRVASTAFPVRRPGALASERGARARARAPRPRRVATRAADAADDASSSSPPDETVFGAEPGSGPGEDPISNEVLLQIVLSQIPDEEVNRLVWDCLGCVPALAPASGTERAAG